MKDSSSVEHLESNKLNAISMGGELGEKSSSKPFLKPGRGKGVFDVAISKLLKDFTSAELLSQTSVSPPEGSTSTNQDTSYETVVSSLKCLHLRRPVASKERKKLSGKRRRLENSLNLAVAATHFQKPIVWPAKLSSHCRKDSSHLINPPRLEFPHTCTRKSTQSNELTFNAADKDFTANEENEKNVVIFGSFTSTDFSKVSFSSLCEQVKCEDKNKLSSCVSHSSKDGTTTMSKRHSSGSVPPAKILKTTHTIGNSALSSHDFIKYRNVGKEDSECLCPHAHCASSSVRASHSSERQLVRSHSPSAVHEAASSDSSASAPVQGLQCEGSINRSCSQEMRMEETNVNELASYFEDLLHIPRKMSTMAEMMYA
ncbi:hypothetical protein Btru_014091 [Bulinus truncatus]|nr:hypothetical protein Btru_014091 [Bulinus truncatus]